MPTSNASKSLSKSTKRIRPRSGAPSGRVLREARELADRYRLLIRQEEDGYIAHVMEMPSVFASGETAAAALQAVQEHTFAAVATLLEMGRTPPAPAAANRRTEQVNVRLTAEEKFRLEEAAKQQGFRGLSDFVRVTALTAA